MPRLLRTFLPVRPQRLYPPAVAAPSAFLARQASVIALRGTRARPAVRQMLVAVPTQSVAFARVSASPRHFAGRAAIQLLRLVAPPAPPSATLALQRIQTTRALRPFGRPPQPSRVIAPTTPPTVLPVSGRFMARARRASLPSRVVVAAYVAPLPVSPLLRAQRVQAARVVRPALLRRPAVLIAPPPVVIAAQLRRLMVGVGR